MRGSRAAHDMARGRICAVSALLLGACSPAAPTSADLGGASSADMARPVRRFFLTRVAYTGSLGGISGADAKCNTDAGKPPGNATWKALLTDGQTRVACSTAKCTGGASEGIDWVLGAATRYLRADGKPLLTTNDAGIVLVYPIANDAAGNRVNFWTGLDTDWTANANRNCNGWTSEMPRIKGRAGWDQDQAQTWIQSTDADCSTALSFGCVEQ